MKKRQDERHKSIINNNAAFYQTKSFSNLINGFFKNFLFLDTLKLNKLNSAFGIFYEKIRNQAQTQNELTSLSPLVRSCARGSKGLRKACCFQVDQILMGPPRHQTLTPLKYLQNNLLIKQN